MYNKTQKEIVSIYNPNITLDRQLDALNPYYEEFDNQFGNYLHSPIMEIATGIVVNNIPIRNHVLAVESLTNKDLYDFNPSGKFLSEQEVKNQTNKMQDDYVNACYDWIDSQKELCEEIQLEFGEEGGTIMVSIFFLKIWRLFCSVNHIINK